MRKRVLHLGYPSLRKFYDDSPELGTSYELLRQVVHGGRSPKTETFQRILSAMRFSPAQARKILELADRGATGRPPEPRSTMQPTGPSAEPPAPERPGAGEEPHVAAADGAADPASLVRELSFGDVEDIAARLSRALQRIPFRGHEDFWETVRHVASLAERKVRDLSSRRIDQPLLFETEPEAIYHFLVRTGKISSYMSKGETATSEFVKGIDYADRFRGALLGAAVGETVARPAQGLSPRDVSELYGGPEEFPSVGRSPKARPRRGRARSALLVLAQSLVEKGTLDPKSLADAYAASVEAGPRGALAEFARNLVERGYPWTEAGIGLPESLPATRNVPLSLLRAGDFRRLKLDAGIDAAITHPNPTAIAGAIAQAASVARLLHTPAGSLDVLGFGRSLSGVISGMESDRSARVRPARPGPSLFRKLGTELPALLMRRASLEEIRDAFGNGPLAVEGIPFAWACFLRAPENFAEAVLSAARFGNDAPGTAAMAGALCGAYAGARAIPPAWLPAVDGRGELETAAAALLAAAVPPTSA